MGLLIGLDIGTSTTKALLLDTDKGVIGSVTADYPLYSPHPGWSEQEPEDMWQATITAILGLLEKFNVDPQAIKGIGLSGQMHSSVFLDSSFNVIRPAILWNDTHKRQCRYIMKMLILIFWFRRSAIPFWRDLLYLKCFGCGIMNLRISKS